MQLWMCKGLPASGKTTWAKAQTDCVRVNKDDIRAMLGGDASRDEKLVLSIEDDIVAKAFKENYSVVVDDTNLNPFHEKRLRSLAEDYKADFFTKEFTASVNECVRRNEERDDSVPENAIREMAKKYSWPPNASTK